MVNRFIKSLKVNIFQLEYVGLSVCDACVEAYSIESKNTANPCRLYM